MLKKLVEKDKLSLNLKVISQDLEQNSKNIEIKKTTHLSGFFYLI
jgi:hypothetical protein